MDCFRDQHFGFPGGTRRPQEAPGRTRTHQDAPNGPSRHQEASEGPRTHQDAPNGPSRHQEASEGPRTHQDAPNGPSRHQEASEGPRTHQEATGGHRSPQEAPCKPRGATHGIPLLLVSSLLPSQSPSPCHYHRHHRHPIGIVLVVITIIGIIIPNTILAQGARGSASRPWLPQGVSTVPVRPSACRQRQHLLTTCAHGENIRHCTGHCRWKARAALAIGWLSASGTHGPQASSRRQSWQSWMPRPFLQPRAQRPKAMQLRSPAHRPQAFQQHRRLQHGACPQPQLA